ncbi:MAG: hypothetical protein RBT59_13605 [Arcobacteraceae bacterium]|jgi:hypothetical protein|nr:hypothetical protein [Arcobacteraceae bacterium]
MKISKMKNNKLKVLSIPDEDKRLKEYKFWNSLSEEEYLKKAYISLCSAKTYGISELDDRLENFLYKDVIRAFAITKYEEFKA